jgi:hypothetical protein
MKKKKKIDLREVILKNGRLAVFIRHGSAEIWEFRYGLTLGNCTVKIMARTGVFLLEVCALKHPISGGGRQPDTFLS